MKLADQPNRRGLRRAFPRHSCRGLIEATAPRPAMPELLFAVEAQAQGSSAYRREEIARRFGWFHDALRVQLTAGRALGEFRHDLDVEAAAVLASGIAESLILRRRISEPAIDMPAEPERVFRILLSGLR